MPTVSITEVYDLSTTKDKMGLIVIRTPSSGAIKKLYQGLWDNYRFVKIKACNVVCACASVLPTDPLSVGVEEGDMAPQDMFNPLLYKAVSNDSCQALISRMYSLGGQGGYGGLEDVPPNTVREFDPLLINSSYDNYAVYYSQLASKGWRKAMPQAGFVMRNVRPFVYPLLNNVGNQLIPTSTSSLNAVPYWNSNTYAGSVTLLGTGSSTFRGPAQPMPRLPTHYLDSTNNIVADTTVPQSPVIAVITPPARLHSLYFRLRVTWYVVFSNVMSLADYESPTDLSEIGAATYGTDITFPESKSPEEIHAVDSVVTADVDLQRVM